MEVLRRQRCRLPDLPRDAEVGMSACGGRKRFRQGRGVSGSGTATDIGGPSSPLRPLILRTGRLRAIVALPKRVHLKPVAREYIGQTTDIKGNAR
jgi:hypothetical protein